MADYYPLIAKAVTGLDKSTGEARWALYDRARSALLAQLRGVEPALSEPDITVVGGARDRLEALDLLTHLRTSCCVTWCCRTSLG